MSKQPWMDQLREWEGQREIKGSRDNPIIVGMFRVSKSSVRDDETPWCSACMNAAFWESELPQFMTYSLLARSWQNAPNCDKVKWRNARYGDLMVMRRGNSTWQGHITAFVRYDGPHHFIGLGGNQSDMVRESRYSRRSLIAIRRPQYVPGTEGLPDEKYPPTQSTEKEESPSTIRPPGDILVPVPLRKPKPKTMKQKLPSAEELLPIGLGGWVALNQDAIMGVVVMVLVVAAVGFYWWKKNRD